MSNGTINPGVLVNPPSHGVISWRSILAGLFVSLIVAAILMTFGMAIGGIVLGNVDDTSQSLRASGIFGGTWSILTAFLSLLAGAYFTARISIFYSRAICMAEGLVVASLFVAVMGLQLVSLTGFAARAAAGVMGSTALAVGSSPNSRAVFGDLVEDQLSGVQLRGDSHAVVAGVLNRLLRGETEAAKNFLATNTSLTRDQVNTNIERISSGLARAGEEARLATAQGLRAMGWIMFSYLIFSVVGALIGGVIGSRANQKSAISDKELPSLRLRAAAFAK
ncbi:hypothetical protein K2X30_13635 [bacterium]|nr:hypothetical protein [bacterium]